MKNYLLLFAIAVLMTACGNKTATQETTSSDTTETTTTPTENTPTNTTKQVTTTTDQPVDYTPEKFKNAITPVDWSKGLKNRRWGIAGRQYEFSNVGDGKYMEAKLVEVKPGTPTEEYLNLSQLVEVRRDESINGWRGRYQIFETPGRYICTMTPTPEGLNITVNTPQGERSAIWQLLKEL